METFPIHVTCSTCDAGFNQGCVTRTTGRALPPGQFHQARIRLAENLNTYDEPKEHPSYAALWDEPKEHPSEYTELPSRTKTPPRLVVLEAIVPDTSDGQEALDTAMDSLRQYGTVVTVKDVSIDHTLDEAIQICLKRDRERG